MDYIKVITLYPIAQGPVNPGDDRDGKKMRLPLAKDSAARHLMGMHVDEPAVETCALTRPR